MLTKKGVVEEVWENAKGPDGLVNDPANYRPELPSNNRSHKYE